MLDEFWLIILTSWSLEEIDFLCQTAFAYESSMN